MTMPAKLTIVFIAISLSFHASGAVVKKSKKATLSTEEITRNAKIWHEPTDVTTRNLYFGPGGPQHVPHGPFTFVKEDLDGSNPKFSVRDRDGVKWKVKLGAEAQPETAATRLVWAVGYFSNEDYFLPTLQVNEMPSHLQRKHADRFIEPDRSMHNVRLKREGDHEKKVGTWRWRDNAFAGTRELNGLKVMMALINNWDLKDENNAVYDDRSSADGDEHVYMVSDLGASFGTAWLDRTPAKSKGNLYWFARTKFIKKRRDGSIDFEDPRRPAFVVLVNPREFVSRLRLRWIGRRIPRSDVEWIAGWLAMLSDKQIRDAFRASGYSEPEVDGFATVVESRIAELSRL